MTSAARLTAARIAVRLAAQGIAAGSLGGSPPPASKRDALVHAVATCMAAQDANRLTNAKARTSIAFASARTLVQKSRLARMLNGAGDLWNGDDRAHQFELLNIAADLRRLTVRTFGA